MIVKSRGRNIEVRAAAFPMPPIPSPAQGVGGVSTWSGRRVGVAEAAGLPAAMNSVRLLSDHIGIMPMKVVTERDGVKVPQPESTQWPLLHDRQNEVQSTFDFWSYIVGCLNWHGNAYALKTKRPARQEVVELYPLDPCRMKVTVENDKLSYEYRDQQGSVTKLTRANLIHFPGLLLDSPWVGCSPVEIHRNSLGGALAQDEFKGRFFANDATPSGIISHPKDLKREQVSALREGFESKHRGVGNSHRVGIMYGGATYEQIGINLRDAQFIEGQRFSIAEIANIFKIFPRKMLDEQLGEDLTDTDLRFFLQISLLPWMKRIELALHADDDLFPDKSLMPAFDPSELLRPDLPTLLEAAHRARQAGIATANEFGRPELGLPAHPDGDVLQATPVGGGPNPDAPEPAQDAPERSIEIHNHLPEQTHTVHVTPTIDATTTVQPADVKVTTPDINVDARTTVEPAAVSVTQPDVNVTVPERNVTVRLPENKPKKLRVLRGKSGVTQLIPEEIDGDN